MFEVGGIAHISKLLRYPRSKLLAHLRHSVPLSRTLNSSCVKAATETRNSSMLLTRSNNKKPHLTSISLLKTDQDVKDSVFRHDLRRFTHYIPRNASRRTGIF